jgi:ribonuclease BN (tRNA processing enzyme)
VISVLLSCAKSPPAAAVPPPMPETAVVMLGTGTPNADPLRSGPAVAVVRAGDAYLVDAGVGLVRRAAATGIEALGAEKLDVVFLTHLHSDHTLGLADLIFTPWVLGREVPLEVYGPPGTQGMVEHLLLAYDADIHNRLDGLQPANDTGWKVNVHEIAPGVVLDDGNVRVTAFAVPHANWATTFGYRFDSADRSIVISGDTRASDAVVDACRGCDVLVHEVISAEGLKTRPPEWQAYHAAAHTNTVELAGIATRAEPKQLVLYHQLYSGGTDDAGLIAEIRAAGFAGALVSAQDLGIY